MSVGRLLMTQSQFDAICKRVKLRADYKNALYDHLVKGDLLEVVANRYSLHLQAISRKSVAIRNLKIYPPGWVESSVWLPKEEMEKVLKLSEKLLIEVEGK